MVDQRSTSTFSLIYLAVGLLSSSPYCTAEPQRHSNIPVLDLSKPPFTHSFDPDIFAPPAVTPDPLEYLERPEDLDEAIYAGRFAKELRRLERMDNDIYTNFITDGFVSDEVPRTLPKFLIRLSRKMAARTSLFEQQGMSMPSSNIRNGVSRSRSVSGSRRSNAASAMGSVLPAATTKFIPIEKGRLVTKTTTTDFGSPFPMMHSSRRGRTHENNQFKFPSHARSFGTMNTHFSY